MKFWNLKLSATDLFYSASSMAMAANSLNNTPTIVVAVQVLMILTSLLAAKLQIKFDVRALWRGHEDQAVMPSAVVGFVDIVSSTAISNSLDLQADFRLRKAFQDLAARRAKQSGISILNDTGDGFLFLANPEGSLDWHFRLVDFCESLTVDFQNLQGTLNLEVDSGLRFGVASGAVIIASLRGNAGQMAAIGPEVSLAARLCAKAEPNEIVFSERVWRAVAGAFKAHKYVNRVHTDLKGFAEQISATHVETAR